MSDTETIDEATSRKLVTDTRLDALGLHETIVSGLNTRGFTHATPIQAETLPLALAGGDIAGQAHTGTGKTAAFLLATLDRLIRQAREPSEQAPSGAAQPRALILAPTRELADQIYQDALPLAADTGLKCVVCYGGTGYDTQREAIAAGVDILIGTPGRLIDYYKQKIYTLKAIEVAVLDEADRMFDLGFIDDIRYMFRKMPAPGRRQNLLFSATLSHRVLELAYEHMNDPKLVRTDTETVNIDAIEQKLYHVSKDDKLALLIGTLRRIGDGRTLHLHQHQAHGRTHSGHAGGQRLQCGHALRRRRTEQASSPAGGIQDRQAADHGRDRRGRPGSAYPGRVARDQFRPAAGCPGLRSSHRPHGPGGQHGPGDLVRLRGVCLLVARHRGLHRTQDRCRDADRGRVRARFHRSPASQAQAAWRWYNRRRNGNRRSSGGR